MTLPLAVLAFFIAADAAAVAALLLTKKRRRRVYRRAVELRTALSSAVIDRDLSGMESLIRRYPDLSVRVWADLRTIFSFPARDVAAVLAVFRTAGVEERLLRKLRSRRPLERFRAARMLLPLVASETAAPVLDALRRETKDYIRLALVKDLLAANEAAAFDGIAESLRDCGMGYFRSVRAMLASSGTRFIGWARSRVGSADLGHAIAILAGARVHATVWLRDYVRSRLDHDDPRVRSTAIEAAQALYPELLSGRAEEPEADIVIRRAALQAEAEVSYPLDLERFAEYLGDPTLRDVAVSSLNHYFSRYPEEIDRTLDLLAGIEDPEARRSLAGALGGRLPFLLVSGEDPERCRPVVEGLAESGRSSEIIALLNSNRDPGTEERLLLWIRPFLDTVPGFRRDCAAYLVPRLREVLGISPGEVPKSSRKIPLTRADRAGLATLLGAVILLPSAGIAVGLSGATIGRTWILVREIFRLFTWGFSFYAVALNLIYILLVLLAGRNLGVQARYWSVLDKEYLFTPGILPSISILAPAYNEAKTVLESVHSLLTLQHPAYEVIVINDGSSDDTMEVLEREFDLERMDPGGAGVLSTAPVRGVYRSRTNAKLRVIDKENGGKADALNAGINLAWCEYVCSIDSDSLLEPDALLRMTAEVLTSDVETAAVGGNILPVNGCTVERGMIQRIALPGNRIAGLQTIEYLRSFIAGRLGWSQLNALLIISGAFGLFRRDRVLEIGGYATGRGEFKRDTVGEDMELVVRLVRRLRETRRRYRIRYAATANCWTEVPEDLGSLYKQRDRWHRGLVEIMTWHRGMLLNPRYGSAGLLAFPYFLVFEMIGPFYEFAGYPFMILGFATGALHPEVFLVMFSAVLLFGLLISLVSLALSERDIVYFRPAELARLLGYSVLENFGFRQLMGWVRVFSFVGFLLRNKGWQKLERKGFRQAPAP